MSTTLAAGSLYTHIENGIATVEFGHPASNSFTSELLSRLTNELQTLSNNDLAHCIVLCSEGEKAFCAGASFDELVAVETKAEGNLFFSGFAHVINAMRTCKKPIIGRAHGKAVGGGVGILAACDYVLATEGAAIKLSELTIGIAPLVIAPAVTRKIGVSGFSELSLDPTKWQNAYWAKEKGLYARVFESVKALDKELSYFAASLASYNPKALENMKSILWEGTEHWSTLLTERAAMTGTLALSEHTKNALKKFKK